jgi:hypothetical protein
MSGTKMIYWADVRSEPMFVSLNGETKTDGNTEYRGTCVGFIRVEHLFDPSLQVAIDFQVDRLRQAFHQTTKWRLANHVKTPKSS